MKRGEKALCVRGDRLYRGGRFVAGWFLVSDGKVVRWGDPDTPPPAGARVLEARGNAVVPGLFDLHVHGFRGIDVTEAGAEKLRALARALARRGTTSFLATFYPSPVEILAGQMRAVREAGLAGVHLEGPFLNPLRAGALSAERLLVPHRATLKKLLAAGDGVMRRMTIAPELPGALPLISQLRDAGVAASMGHSDARLEEARSGAAAGARSVTHLFNAMRPFHHREPGLAGYALLDPELSCELIGDLRHVAQGALELALQCKESPIFVSDCLPGAGTGRRRFETAGASHEIRAGACYLAGTKTLSGSCRTLLEIVRGLVRRGILSLEKAVACAATAPAAQAGYGSIKGDLTTGNDADFLVLEKDLSLDAVFLRGERLLG